MLPFTRSWAAGPTSVRRSLVDRPVTVVARTSSDVNSNPVVVRLEYGCFSVLLTGDIEQEGAGALLASEQPVGSLILKVPDHGGEDAPTLPFIQALDPQRAIISVGSDNRFGHPGELTLEKLQDIFTCRADQQGRPEMMTDGERYQCRRVGSHLLGYSHPASRACICLSTCC